MPAAAGLVSQKLSLKEHQGDEAIGLFQLSGGQGSAGLSDHTACGKAADVFGSVPILGQDPARERVGRMRRLFGAVAR
jgi:hypothetical protein